MKNAHGKLSVELIFVNLLAQFLCRTLWWPQVLSWALHFY